MKRGAEMLTKMLQVCLVAGLLFCVGCDSSYQANLEKRPDTSAQETLESQQTKCGKVAESFFEAYPENWEHSYRGQDVLAKSSKHSRD